MADIAPKEDTGQGRAGEHAVSVAPPTPTATEPVAPVVEPPKTRATRATRPNADAPEEEEEMVSVPKKTLDSILKRLDSVEDKNKILESVADKGRMARVEQLRAQGKLVKSVRVGKIGDKFVIGWKLIEDDVHFDNEGKLVEVQTIKVFYEDKSTAEFNVRNFANSMERIEGEVTSEGKDRDGNITLVVLFPDGNEITVNQTFINP